MRKSFLLQIIAFCALAFAGLIVDLQAAPQLQPAKFQKGRLSISYTNIPIETVLREVALKSGVPIWLDPEVKGMVTMRLHGVPLEPAMRRLLRRQSHAFFYRDLPKGGYELSKIKVFKPGNRELAKYVVLGGGKAGADEKKAIPDSEQAVSEMKNSKGQAVQAVRETHREMALAARRQRAEEKNRRWRMAHLRTGMRSGAPPKVIIEALKDVDQPEHERWQQPKRPVKLNVQMRRTKETPQDRQWQSRAVNQRLSGLMRYRNAPGKPHREKQ